MARRAFVPYRGQARGRSPWVTLPLQPMPHRRPSRGPTGEQVTSPSPVASVESVGRRKIGRYLPGTPDALGARETKGPHQVNQVVAQSKAIRRLVDRLHTHRFDFWRGRCHRFGCPRRRRSLRMCRKRPCRSRASEQTDELAPHGSSIDALRLASRLRARRAGRQSA